MSKKLDNVAKIDIVLTTNDGKYKVIPIANDDNALKKFNKTPDNAQKYLFDNFKTNIDAGTVLPLAGPSVPLTPQFIAINISKNMEEYFLNNRSNELAVKIIKEVQGTAASLLIDTSSRLRNAVITMLRNNDMNVSDTVSDTILEPYKTAYTTYLTNLTTNLSNNDYWKGVTEDLKNKEKVSFIVEEKIALILKFYDLNKTNLLLGGSKKRKSRKGKRKGRSRKIKRKHR